MGVDDDLWIPQYFFPPDDTDRTESERGSTQIRAQSEKAEEDKSYFE